MEKVLSFFADDSPKGHMVLAIAFALHALIHFWIHGTLAYLGYVAITLSIMKVILAYLYFKKQRSSSK